MARIKALTKADKAEQIASLKTAMKTAQGPLNEARTKHAEANKAHKAAHKEAAAAYKAFVAAGVKLEKFIAATETGKAKLQAKIDDIAAAPLLSLPKGPKPKVAAPAAKKAADKVIAKAKGKGKVSTAVAGQPALL